MNISLDWLKDYVKVDAPLAQLVERLTMIGLVAESWEDKDGDTVLDLETYANRPDTLGHLGVAREIAAAFGLPLEERRWPVVESSEETASAAAIRVVDEDLCPRYCGILVKGLKVGPSPAWLKRRIEAVGLNSVNNVVDVTNYVLHETAHPIHAFDWSKIGGGAIVIRRAVKGERLTILDGREVVLAPDHLVIADESRPVALAGVVGGLETGVSEATRTVFIESACFDPVAVRRAAKTLGIQTDASYRFERGADLAFPPRAARMAASLLTQMGGQATRGILDIFPRPRKNRIVMLRHQRTRDFLGAAVDAGDIERILSALGFVSEAQDGGVWRVEVPSFRVDVEREADVIEEIARFYGYDRIPSVATPLKVVEPVVDRRRERIDRVRTLLFHHGYTEVLNQSFSEPDKEARFGTGRDPVVLRNPISARASILRTTLAGSLIDTVAYNLRREAAGAHVFEIGNVYYRSNEQPVEQLTLGLAGLGPLGPRGWDRPGAEADFFDLKGALEALMAQLRIIPFEFAAGSCPWLEPERSLDVTYRGEKLGSLGSLRKDLALRDGLPETVWMAEIDLTALLAKTPPAFRTAPVGRFPSVVRDVAFLADRARSYQDVRKAVEKAAPAALESFELVDRYEGDGVPPDKVSLTLRLVFRHPQRTLVADEVDKLEQALLLQLQAAVRVEPRAGGRIDNRARKN
ncbi:MAG: phenylalanine--tRNA ligase subunit beta [Candidatus Aminicenantes bacterium]|nr:phenylalanine--tRNA ligase subunit beta [Candidatus Aminicenantes bacterium]